MKRFIIGVVCLILVAGFGASARAAQSLIPGDWVGGYDINRNYTPIRTGFSLEGAGIKGTLNLPVRGVTSVALDQVRFLSPNLHFELPRSAGPLIFDGRLSGDFITGNIQSGSERGTFHLVRAVTLDANVFDQYLGEYQIGRDSYVSIGPTPPDEPTVGIMYFVHDLSSPKHRGGRLFATSETAFVAGPGKWVPYPVEIYAAFVTNEQGQVTALKWKPTGSAEVTAKKVTLHLYDEEKVMFSNGDVTLAGTLVLPLTKGPHPAVVLLPGSDGGEPPSAKLVTAPSRGRGFGLPEFFAQHGIAALTFDKRGSGGSTGTRIGATVEDMAGDAAAGVHFLQKRPDIDRSKVGVWAISQGG